MSSTDNQPITDQNDSHLIELKVLVSEELHRAFQRCLWLRLNETGHSRLELSTEMVRDFLVKHGC